MNKQKEIADKMLNCIEYKYRNEKDQEDGFYSFKIEAISEKTPEFQALSDAFYRGDTATGDYEYKCVAEMLEAMAEYLEDNDNLDNFEAYEIADQCVPIYNYDRTKWLHDNLNNASWVDEAMAECEVKEVFPAIGYGMEKVAAEIGYNIKSAIENLAEEQE